MEKALIELQAILDEEKSKRNINTSINKLQSQLDKLKLQTEIDPKTISKFAGQLERALNQKIDISKPQQEIEIQQAKLSNDIQNWLTKNSHASKEAKESLNEYYRELNNGNASADRLHYIRQELNSLGTEPHGLGKLAQNIKEQFSEAGAVLTQWLSIGSGVTALISQLQKIPAEVIKIDSAITKLSRTSDASDSSIKKYFDEAAESAKDLGISVSDIISATADWSRMGYSLPDSKKLAEAAALYKNIGNGIDMGTASEALAGTLQGFELDADEAMHIIDAFNEVGKSLPIGSDGIGEALTKSASSMYAAGNTLEETIGLVTAASSAMQDPDAIGTLYETISMRIRTAAAEMEALGLETEGMAESTTALQAEILALSGVDIMDGKNTLKSTYQILDELAAKWQGLTDIQQASIAELIVGKGQGNIVSALMDNFETARQATEAAVNSTGSALKEQEKYEQGIQYSLDRLGASFQAFAGHVLDSGFLKGIIDFGSGTINVLDAVTSKLGSLGTIGLGAGIFAGFKNVGSPKRFGLKLF